MHNASYLHRDIKPDNILIGNRKEKINQIYLVDFGLCKKYLHPETKKHIPYRDSK